VVDTSENPMARSRPGGTTPQADQAFLNKAAGGFNVCETASSSYQVDDVIVVW